MQNAWLLPAIGSAVFASLTAILAKIGIAGVDSNIATAIRTTVILLFAWGIVAAQGRFGTIGALSGRTWLFLGLSGVATGCSWLCYFYALKIGPVARVATIDKLSLVVTIVLSVVVLHEAASLRVWFGAALMIVGAFIATR
jgi:transporter family protein